MEQNSASLHCFGCKMPHWRKWDVVSIARRDDGVHGQQGRNGRQTDRNGRYPELEGSEVTVGERGSSVQNPVGYVSSSEERK